MQLHEGFTHAGRNQRSYSGEQMLADSVRAMCSRPPDTSQDLGEDVQPKDLQNQV